MKKLALVLAAILGFCGIAHAQSTPPLATVVATCGTPPSTYSAGQNRPITQNTSGLQCTGATVTPGGTQDVNLKQVNGAAVNVGTGAASTGTQRVTTSTDSTIGTVTSVTSATVVQPTGTNLHAVLDTTSTTAATQATGTNLHTVTDLTSVSQAVPGTSGGLTIATVTAANSTNATNLKASAGQLYHIAAYNNSATLAWISFYNTAGTPTCGASIVYQAMIPANSTSGGGVVDDIPAGLAFSTGIGYCITTGIAGTGSVAASAYVASFGFK